MMTNPHLRKLLISSSDYSLLGKNSGYLEPLRIRLPVKNSGKLLAEKMEN